MGRSQQAGFLHLRNPAGAAFGKEGSEPPFAAPSSMGRWRLRAGMLAPFDTAS